MASYTNSIVNQYVRSSYCRSNCPDFTTLPLARNTVLSREYFNANGHSVVVSDEYEFKTNSINGSPVPRRFCGCFLTRKKSRNVYLEDIEEISQITWSFHMILKSEVQDIMLQKQSKYEIACICDECWNLLKREKQLTQARYPTPGLPVEVFTKTHQETDIYYEDIFDAHVGINRNQRYFIPSIYEHYHVLGDTDWEAIEENQIPEDCLPEHLAIQYFRYPTTDKNRLSAWIRNDVDNPLSAICHGNCSNRLYEVSLDFNMAKPGSPVGFNFVSDSEDDIRITPPNSPAPSVSTVEMIDIDDSFPFTLQEIFDESITDELYDECDLTIDELKLEDYFDNDEQLLQYLTQLQDDLNDCYSPEYFPENDFDNF